jgi:DNA-binding GntR family transcriptional regulator
MGAFAYPGCCIQDAGCGEHVAVTVRPVKREPNRLVDEVHERLLEMISTGLLPPDSRLHQGRLADELGVSRTPVREALLRLEREGLVYTSPGRGMFVRGVSPEEVREVYEVREVLEPFAARLACLRATARDVSAVEAIQRRHERSYPRDLAVAFRSNMELHMGLTRACGNQLVLRFLESVWHQDTSIRAFAFQTRDPATVSGMVQEHREIVDAFKAGDGDAVERLLRRHIRAAYEALEAGLAEVRGTEVR